jgi:alkylation response protein AidB-like acyl-CoA dehydrogenase
VSLVRRFALSDEQQLFADSARRFLQARAPVAALRKLRDGRDAQGFDRELWAELAGMGWAGVLVPERHGGVGFGYAGAGLAAEEAGRTLTPLPLLSTAVLGVTALLAGASEERQSELLPAIAGGEILMALAVDERARHAPHDIATRAVPSAGGFRLAGRKTFVLDGHVADWLIVPARLAEDAAEPDALRLFLVKRGAPGVTLERTIMVDSRNAAELRLDDVEVPGRDAFTAGGAVLLDRILDAGRAVLAAELVGIAAEALDRTLEYLRQREQFGRKVGEFQALQHRAAQVYCDIELARSATAAALRALDAGADDTPLLVSVAKAKAGEAARLATNEALQMHGGIGMTDESDIGFFMKRARAAAETFGDFAFHGDRVARFYGF